VGVSEGSEPPTTLEQQNPQNAVAQSIQLPAHGRHRPLRLNEYRLLSRDENREFALAAPSAAAYWPDAAENLTSLGVADDS